MSTVPALSRQRQILFFDSGCGGLSICAAVMQACPELCPSYLLDNRFFPYSERSDEVIIDRVAGLICSLCAVQHFDIIVVACNTASTIALPALRARLAVPVVGVVPAIKPAARLSVRRHICLLATKATIARPYTDALIADFAAGCRVMRIGSTRLVELAEDRLHGRQVSAEEVRSVLRPYLDCASAERPDVMVLGCTHFPFLRPELQHAAGAGCRLLDSGEAIARRVQSLVAGSSACSSQDGAAQPPAGGCVYCTAPPGDMEAELRPFRRVGLQTLICLDRPFGP